MKRPEETDPKPKQGVRASRKNALQDLATSMYPHRHANHPDDGQKAMGLLDDLSSARHRVRAAQKIT